MPDRGYVIRDLDMQIRWIEDTPAHQFPGWQNVTIAMRNAMELLMSSEEPERLERLEQKIREFRE